MWWPLEQMHRSCRRPQRCWNLTAPPLLLIISESASRFILWVRHWMKWGRPDFTEPALKFEKLNLTWPTQFDSFVYAQPISPMELTGIPSLMLAFSDIFLIWHFYGGGEWKSTHKSPWSPHSGCLPLGSPIRGEVALWSRHGKFWQILWAAVFIVRAISSPSATFCCCCCQCFELPTFWHLIG